MSIPNSSTINERTSARLSIDWIDPAGEPAIPSAVSYRIDCLTTGGVVRAMTTVAPAATTEIHLDSDDNAIRDTANSSERRCVTVVASYGDASDQCSLEYVYTVRNLRYLQ